MTGEMRVVHTPEPKHHCGPNQYGHMSTDLWNEAPGTVVECDHPGRGKSYVAYKPRAGSGYMGVLWSREGWLARRRRLKRAKKK